MALTPGTRLGPYEIVGALGAGGMGDVFRATDTRLSRTVAIKVLPEHWSDNAEMKQRFEREARTIASLSDPRICTLHDVGHEAPSTGSGQAGIDFLVMEYLEGETLAARIATGPLELDEVLQIAIAIAGALDVAHRQGVVHRDLKPSNVMLTADGAKLLDFGLAKATQGTATASRELSAAGAVIGTLQYMAPEQLEGAEADARTDIFALGVVIHEMVTGKKVFEGKSRVLLMSAIATSQPQPLSVANAATPPALEHIVQACLAKDPADRWQTVRDVLGELQALADDDTDVVTVGPAARRSRGGTWLYRGLAAAALIVGAVVSVPALFYMRGEAPPGELRFRLPMQLTSQPGTVGLPQTASGANFGLSSFAMSPDGRSIAFVARQNGNEPFMLFVRPIGAVVPQPLTTADGRAQPFWSADGRSIAFVAGGRLKKIPASGGPPQDLAPVSDFYGGAWNREGVIIFGSSKGIQRVPAEGGTPEPLTSIEAPETSHFWPSFLPDGQHYLYTAWSADAPARAIYAGRIGSKDKVRVLAVESNAMYSENGYLLFHRGRALYAQSFDVKTLALSGEPSRVADEVSFDEEDGRGHFAASPSGVLAYFENRAGGANAGAANDFGGTWHLAWANRGGQVLDRPGSAAIIRGLDVSPDAKRIAVHRHEVSGGDIWIIEPSGSETRLTWDASQDNSSPVWSPDGRDIVFSSQRGGKSGLYRKRSDGSATEELLIESELPKAPMSWSPDGKFIVYWVQDPKTSGNLWLLSLADKQARPFINSPFTETHAQISPDGKWIAYTSDSVGKRREVHVQPFPSGDGRWQISDAGGDWPRWRRDNKELSYHSIGPTANPQTPGNLIFTGPIYAVSVNGVGGAFEHTAPKGVLNLRAFNIPHGGGDYHTYAVAPSGERFLFFQFVFPTSATTAQAAGPDPDHTVGLMIATNWQQGLKK